MKKNKFNLPFIVYLACNTSTNMGFLSGVVVRKFTKILVGRFIMRTIVVLIVTGLFVSVGWGETNIQSGWFDFDQTQDNLLYAWDNEYVLEMSDSRNNHIGRDGTITGAKFLVQGYSYIRSAGVVILRSTTGTKYTIIGKSQELTTFANGVNTVVFTTPIANVLSTDTIALAISGKGSTVFGYISTATKCPIDDSSTAKIRWNLSGSSDYSAYAVGKTVNCDGGGSTFGVIQIAAFMDSPKVIVVGDSISEGAQLNYSYRNNALVKDRYGAYAAVGYRALGWTFELAGNTQSSNNSTEVLASDLVELGHITVWDKHPEYLHLHVGVNDIFDGRTWTQYSASLDSILAKCRTNNCKLVLSAIFPWTGNAANSTGSAAQNTLRDIWNKNLITWVAGKSDVYFININNCLGQERLIAKRGDDAPPSGNLWDLIPHYVQAADGLGVHLSQQGCAVAGSAMARELNRLLEGDVADGYVFLDVGSSKGVRCKI